MKSTYDSLSKSKEFDDDINLYTSFLAGDGFFKYYKISVQHWFRMHNWWKPHDRPVKKTLLIREILKLPYGPNYLRVSMSEMEWWKA